jgi:hypothetical protein
VFLVLLCNDWAVLGPWVNTLRQNIVAWAIVWSLVLLSLALTATTFFPGLSTATLEGGLAAGAAVGVLGGAVAIIGGRRSSDRRESKLPRAERRALRQQDRLDWQTPNLASLARPAISPIRRAGLSILRGYLVMAVVFVVIKVVQAGMT